MLPAAPLVPHPAQTLQMLLYSPAGLDVRGPPAMTAMREHRTAWLSSSQPAAALHHLPSIDAAITHSPHTAARVQADFPVYLERKRDKEHSALPAAHPWTSRQRQYGAW